MKPSEMVLLKYAFSSVKERAKLLHKAGWTLAAIKGVSTFEPPYGAQGNPPVIGVHRAKVISTKFEVFEIHLGLVSLVNYRS